MSNLDDLSYFQFTDRQRRDKALSELTGILQGMACDREFHPKEIRELRDWQRSHDSLFGPRDFLEIDAAVSRAIADGRLDSDEVEEISALCVRASSNSPYFDAVTKSLQELFGYLHGILSDRTVKPEELKALLLWMDDYGFLLNQVYPFTEIQSLIVGVLRDKTVDVNEQRALQAFFSQFVALSPNQSDYLAELRLSAKELCVGGICAVDPEITIAGKKFCFTGFSSRGKKSDFAATISQRGGTYEENVVISLDYLIIGADGNPAWAYTCYGRKVERAVQLRKSGNPLLIVHENDFWDTIVE